MDPVLILLNNLARYGAPAEAGESGRLQPALHCPDQVTLLSTLQRMRRVMVLKTTNNGKATSSALSPIGSTGNRENQYSVFDLKGATLSSKLDSLFEASWRDGSH